MKILAIDTATEACSVALGLGASRIERYAEFQRGHAEHLLPMVDEVLAEAGIPLNSLDAIAFGRGPGAFTGVRLAASVAQGLAFGAGLGVVPVSDLAAVAQQAFVLQPAARRVLAITDARMREVYWAEFNIVRIAQPAGVEHVSAAADVVIPVAEGEVWLAAGRGLRASPELVQRCLAAGAVLLPDLLPRASEVLDLAQSAVAAGQILPPESALPIYVRDRVVAAAT